MPLYLIGGAVLVLSALWLIILYNQIVNLHHSISGTNSDFQTLQARNAELKDTILGFYNDETLSRLAEERRLIQDKKPQYLEANQQWVLASHL